MLAFETTASIAEQQTGQSLPVVILRTLHGKVGEQRAHPVVGDTGNGATVQTNIKATQQYKLKVAIRG